MSLGAPPSIVSRTLYVLTGEYRTFGTEWVSPSTRKPVTLCHTPIRQLMATCSTALAHKWLHSGRYLSRAEAFVPQVLTTHLVGPIGQDPKGFVYGRFVAGDPLSSRRARGSTARPARHADGTRCDACRTLGVLFCDATALPYLQCEVSQSVSLRTVAIEWLALDDSWNPVYVGPGSVGVPEHLRHTVAANIKTRACAPVAWLPATGWEAPSLCLPRDDPEFSPLPDTFGDLDFSPLPGACGSPCPLDLEPFPPRPASPLLPEPPALPQLDDSHLEGYPPPSRHPLPWDMPEPAADLPLPASSPSSSPSPPPPARPASTPPSAAPPSATTPATAPTSPSPRRPASATPDSDPRATKRHCSARSRVAAA
jgi:hypothetical protein